MYTGEGAESEVDGWMDGLDRYENSYLKLQANEMNIKLNKSLN